MLQAWYTFGVTSSKVPSSLQKYQELKQANLFLLVLAPQPGQIPEEEKALGESVSRMPELRAGIKTDCVTAVVKRFKIQLQRCVSSYICAHLHA